MIRSLLGPEAMKKSGYIWIQGMSAAGNSVEQYNNSCVQTCQGGDQRGIDSRAIEDEEVEQKGLDRGYNKKYLQ
jgi:hypothetical protein